VATSRQMAHGVRGTEGVGANRGKSPGGTPSLVSALLITLFSPSAMSARSLLGQGGQAPLFYALPLCGLGSGIEIDANLFQIGKANKR